MTTPPAPPPDPARLAALAAVCAAQINATLRPHEGPVAPTDPAVLAVAAGLLASVRPNWIVVLNGYGACTLHWQRVGGIWHFNVRAEWTGPRQATS